MKRTIAPTALVVVFVTMFVLGILPRVQAGEQLGAQAGERRGCSNASLLGSFGFSATGTLLALPPPFAGPFAEIGRQTFDGSGSTEGTATLSANGNINHVTFVGTYVVSPDCTGSMTVLVLPLNREITLEFVIDDDETEIRALLTSSPSGNTESRVYKKQFSRGRKD